MPVRACGFESRLPHQLTTATPCASPHLQLTLVQAWRRVYHPSEPTMPDLASALAKRLSFYYGWVVVAVTGLLGFSAVSFGPGVLGTLFVPMSDELHWSRTAVSGALMAGSVFVVIIGPLSGRMVDRYGVRPVAVASAAVMAISLIGLGFVNSILMFYVFFGAGYALFTGVSRVAVSANTAKWFVRRRGIATSVSNASGALGFVVLPLLATVAMQQWGWRAGWIVLGVPMLALVVPATVLLLKGEPSDVGQLIDGDRTEDEGRRVNRLGRSAASEVQWTLREALHTPALWMLTIVLGLQALSTGGVQIHLIPHLRDQGFSPTIAVVSYTLGGTFHALSAFVWGPIADRIETRFVYAAGSILMVLHVLSIILASAIYPVLSVIVIGVTMGVAFGATAMVMRIAYANYFGRQSAGTIQGAVVPIQMILGGSGALIAGLMYDAIGGYLVSFTLFMGLIVVTIPIFLLTPTPKKQAVTA